MKAKLALMVAIANDVVDYAGVGAIPVAGDVLDVATTAILVPLIGPTEAVVTLAELIPGADILPIFTIVTIIGLVRHQ